MRGLIRLRLFCNEGIQGCHLSVADTIHCCHQGEDMARWRKYATPEMRPRYYGMVQTTWMNTGGFLDGFYGNLSTEPGGSPSQKS